MKLYEQLTDYVDRFGEHPPICYDCGYYWSQYAAHDYGFLCVYCRQERILTMKDAIIRGLENKNKALQLQKDLYAAQVYREYTQTAEAVTLVDRMSNEDTLDILKSLEGDYEDIKDLFRPKKRNKKSVRNQKKVGVRK